MRQQDGMCLGVRGVESPAEGVAQAVVQPGGADAQRARGDASPVQGLGPRLQIARLRNHAGERPRQGPDPFYRQRR